MTFDNEITEVFKSKLFCDMCKRYGGNNHLDLRSEVILIILELPEEKKQMIIENGQTSINLTPENKFEIDVIEKVHNNKALHSIETEISASYSYSVLSNHLIKITLKEKNQ